MPRARNAGALLLALALGAAPVAASRWALCIGSDGGLPGERNLRFAGRDAVRMAAVLRASPTFSGGVVRCLANPKADAAERLLSETAAEMAADKRAGGHPLFLFYFSGHGKGGGIHFAGKELSKDWLAAYFGSLQADMKIVILDACEAGDFLRMKGGKYEGEERTFTQEPLDPKGVIVLGSSARGELSQESEEYQGGVFSHHLFNGLTGLADYDGDGRVTTMEAFDYARKATQLESGGDAGPKQHPTFDFDVVGSMDVELARPGGEAKVKFDGFDAIGIEVIEAATQQRVSSAWLTGRKTVEMSLPHGRYMLVARDGEERRVAEADLVWRREMRLSAADFRPIRKGAFASKGYAAERPLAVRAELAASRPIGPRYGFQGKAGLQWQTGYWEPEFFAGYGQGSRPSVNGFAVEDKHWICGLGVSRPVATFRFGRITMGMRATFDRIIQEVRDERFKGDSVANEAGLLPSSRTLKANEYGVSLPLVWETYLSRRISPTLSAVPEAMWHRDAATGEWRMAWAPGLGIGLDFLF